MSHFARILSIDPGTNRTGFAILDIDIDGNITIPFAETFAADHYVKRFKFLSSIHGSRFARIHLTGKQLSRLLHLYTPDIVGSEAPYLGKFPQSYAALSELLHEFKSCTHDYSLSIPLEYIDPASVKVVVGVKGKSGDKNKMTRALRKIKINYIDVDPTAFDEHTVDAVCVGVYYVRKLLADTGDLLC